jgi:hypothetical protein
MIGKFLSLFSSLILLFASSSVAPASTNISENRYLGSNETLYSIYAPASPTVQLSERYQGKFAQPNMPLDFLISVYTYFGQEGIYNITTNSTWPVFFYSASGKFLEDTNGDGIIDTGETAVAEQFDVHVRIIPPVTLNPGDSDNFDVVLSSVQYPGQQVITSIQVAVPAPFAHIYNGRSTGEFGMSMWDVAISIYRSEQANTVYLANDLLRPTGGWDNSIVEAQPGNFVYISHSYDSKFAGYEVDCSKLDLDGNPVWPVIVLDDHSNSMISTSDDTPTVAVSPDGSVGIVWQRTMMTNLGTNTNIYFAIIDSSGHLKNGLVNVTNNQVFGSINDPNYPSYDLPVIAATSNNSFFLAWHHGVSSPGWVDNIDYAIFTSSGEVLKAPTNLTNAQVGSGNLFSAPSVAGLSNQRVLITYLNGNPFNLNLWYLVLDSSGNTVSSPKLITDDGTSGSAWIRADSAELSNGRIIVAWNTYQDLRFVILDSSYIYLSRRASPGKQYCPGEILFILEIYTMP